MEGRIIISKVNNFNVLIFFDGNGHPVDLKIEDMSQESIIENIYIGKVINIVKNINAAFVEFAPGKMGYLSLKESSNPIIGTPKRKDVLTEGDEIVVQVVKEAIKTKEPVLTSNISITGKYCVIIHNKKDISFSKKIASQDKRDALKKIIEPVLTDDFGVIVRTNAENTNEQLIIEELYDLKEKLNNIIQTGKYRTLYSKLYVSPSGFRTLVRDFYLKEIQEIVTDDEEIYNKINSYIDNGFSELKNKVRFYNDKIVSLRSLYRFEKILRDTFNQKVWLRSGGYLIIQPTEALVVIDVNSGKNVSKKEAQAEFLKLNKEAAKEIARQLRLRNLSGIIIVDFVNLKDMNAKRELLDYFQQQLRQDHVQTTVVDMTKLNLVEVTRKKIKRPLHEIIKDKKLL